MVVVRVVNLLVVNLLVARLSEVADLLLGATLRVVNLEIDRSVHQTDPLPMLLFLPLLLPLLLLLPLPLIDFLILTLLLILFYETFCVSNYV